MTTDPRIAVLSAMSSPDWHPVPEAHGMPWDEAEALLAAYDASRAVAQSAPAETALRERIAVLHQPVAGEADTQWCSTCSQEEIQPQPVGWRVPWPCPTLQAVDELPAVLPAAVCICGHTEQQHFEDACITDVTGCDCGDYLTPEAAREVIDRLQAALRKAPAVSSVGQAAHTTRSAALREAADAIDHETQQLRDHEVLESDRYRPCRDASAQLRRMADEAPGPWLVQKICCGRDDGEIEFATWEEADRFREEYIDSARIASHERSAIVRAAGADELPAVGEARL